MSQHDMVLDDQPGASYRADGNNRAAALVSNNSGATPPVPTFAHQWWPDTSTGLLKVRNAANTAWVTVGLYDTTNFGAALLAANQAFTKGQVVTPSTITDQATLVVDFSASNHHTVTLADSRIMGVPTYGTPAHGQSGVIAFIQDAAGGRAITSWAADWKFPAGEVPTLTATPNAVDFLSYYIHASGYVAASLQGDFK